jgi:hypothetical protein
MSPLGSGAKCIPRQHNDIGLFMSEGHGPS